MKSVLSFFKLIMQYFIRTGRGVKELSLVLLRENLIYFLLIGGLELSKQKREEVILLTEKSEGLTVDIELIVSHYVRWLSISQHVQLSLHLSI